MDIRKIVIGSGMGFLVGLLATAAWAEPSPVTQKLVAAHHQAAAEARQKVVFHEEMAKSYETGRGGGKIDMVGHCRFWASYYGKLATQEEQAAKELEQKVP